VSCIFHCDGGHPDLPSFPTRRSSDLMAMPRPWPASGCDPQLDISPTALRTAMPRGSLRFLRRNSSGSTFCAAASSSMKPSMAYRSEEHTSELQSLRHLVCRLLLEKKK